ncbi:MAG: hypothetical protein LUD16_03240 [Lachnospiraceae bacterium]|nr:hypothetical protein [Lachnospiraceae bacterium]
MDKMYRRPVVLANEEISEGVYTASGNGTGCYSVSAYITQTPETGRETYVIQVNAKHDADHTSSSQTLVLSFNQAVTYVSSGGSLKSGDGTSTLYIDYTYWNNASDNIGLGDVYVSAGDGLVITGYSLICNG